MSEFLTHGSDVYVSLAQYRIAISIGRWNAYVNASIGSSECGLLMEDIST